MSELLYTLRRGLIAFLLLLPAFSHSQGTISGKITDSATDAGIEGAVVSINGTFLQTVTNADGSFSLPAANDTSVTITHLSYQPLTISVHEGNNSIKLIRRTYLTEEVTISSSRADKKSAVAFNDVSKADIEKINNGRDFPFLLNSIPSVVVTSDAGAGVGYTGIRVRGSDATRVNVTINGIPVNDPESHQVYWVDLPDIASSVENVQVQRGLGNSTNGAGAFGASINVLTNKISTEPYGTVSSSAGSFNTFKNTVSFGSGLLSNAFAVEGRLSKITSDGYIDRATSDLKSFYLSGGYYGKKNSLRFVTFSGQEKTYQAWYGVPQDSLNTNRTYNPAGEYYDADGNVHYYDDQTDNYQQDYYQLFYSHEINSKLILNTALFYTHGEGYYEEYKQDADLNGYSFPEITIGDSTITNADLIRRKWLSNDFYGANVSLEYSFQRLKLQAGVSGNYYEGEHYNEVIASEVMPLLNYPFEYYNDMSYKTDISAFVRAIYSISDHTDITIDLQQRHLEYTYTGFDENLGSARKTSSPDFFNPKAGINYSPKENMQFYLFAGIGHKEPVRDDYMNASPNDSLQPEKMIDLEGGMKMRMRNAMFGVNLYYMYYDNQLILTGKINDVGEYIRQNVEKSFRSGVEVDGEYKFSPKFYAKANATFSVNKIEVFREYLDDYDTWTQVVQEYKNTPISFSPSVTGYAAFGVSVLKGLNAEVSGKYVGRQFLTNTGNDASSLEAYFVSDLHLSYTLTPKKIKELTFRVSLFNLTNSEYSANGATYSGYSGGVRFDSNYYYPQALLNFSAGVLLKL